MYQMNPTDLFRVKWSRKWSSDRDQDIVVVSFSAQTEHRGEIRFDLHCSDKGIVRDLESTMSLAQLQGIADQFMFCTVMLNQGDGAVKTDTEVIFFCCNCQEQGFQFPIPTNRWKVDSQGYITCLEVYGEFVEGTRFYLHASHKVCLGSFLRRAKRMVQSMTVIAEFDDAAYGTRLSTETKQARIDKFGDKINSILSTLGNSSNCDVTVRHRPQGSK